MAKRASRGVWSESEKERLVSSAKALKKKLGRTLRAKDLRKIKLPGRTFAAIKSQAARLGLYAPNRKLLKWSEREEQLLVLLSEKRKLGARGMQTRGFFSTEANSWNVRTIDSIAQKLRRNGLADPERSQRARTARRLTKEQRKNLRKDLRENRDQKSSAEFAAEYGVSPSTIRRYRKKWRIPHSWKGAMALPSSVAKREFQAARTRERNLERWRETKEKLLTRLERRKASVLKQRGDTQAMRQCQRCEREWPETSQFFAFSPKRRDGRVVKKYLRRVCRVCPRRASEPHPVHSTTRRRSPARRNGTTG
ncbi:MAG: hypothetical protein AAF517_23500 [Planctomycetota bacterium]